MKPTLASFGVTLLLSSIYHDSFGLVCGGLYTEAMSQVHAALTRLLPSVQVFSIVCRSLALLDII